MEIVELYCELLLARAAVLDQIAFSDKGVQARNKAKEEAKQLFEAGAKTGLAENKDGGGRGFGWFSSTRTTATKTPEKSQVKPQLESTGDESDQFDEENCYINPAIDEAAAAIFYSCPRFPREVKELTTLRTLLMERWGKEFATLAQENKAGVKLPDRLVKRLRVKPPSEELVESYLREIANAYGVVWPANQEIEGDIPEPMQEEEDQPAPSSSPPPPPESGDIGNAPGPQTPRKNLPDMRLGSEADELSRATPPRDIGTHDVTGKSPVSVAKPGPRSDNPEPRVRIPGEKGNNAGDERPGGGLQRKDSKGIPDVDELSKRFAALKR
jgi:vacuolar protein sorting-associated protein IST1